MTPEVLIDSPKNPPHWSSAANLSSTNSSSSPLLQSTCCYFKYIPYSCFRVLILPYFSQNYNIALFLLPVSSVAFLEKKLSCYRLGRGLLKQQLSSKKIFRTYIRTTSLFWIEWATCNWQDETFMYRHPIGIWFKVSHELIQLIPARFYCMFFFSSGGGNNSTNFSYQVSF